MKKIALCVYTDDANYRLENDGNITNLSFEYELFFDYNVNLYKALKNISVKKRIAELECMSEFTTCIGFDPRRANLEDFILPEPKESVVYYAYGGYNNSKYVGSASPSLFSAMTVEFNRVCEFVENYNNIADLRVTTIPEKFLFHIRSLYLESECINYENSSMFIRSA